MSLPSTRCMNSRPTSTLSDTARGGSGGQAAWTCGAGAAAGAHGNARASDGVRFAANKSAHFSPGVGLCHTTAPHPRRWADAGDGRWRACTCVGLIAGVLAVPTVRARGDDGEKRSHRTQSTRPFECHVTTRVSATFADEGAFQVGTNTAELGVLGVPMVVALPTNALEVFRGAAGGFTGLLTRLPGPLGDALTRAVNARMLATRGWLSWPNIWAREEVVPELVGKLTVRASSISIVEFIRFVVLKLGETGPLLIQVDDVATTVTQLLSDTRKLRCLRQRLASLTLEGAVAPTSSGGGSESAPGAASALAREAFSLLASSDRAPPAARP